VVVAKNSDPDTESMHRRILMVGLFAINEGIQDVADNIYCPAKGCIYSTGDARLH
jgi:hypothetical protein